MKVPMPVAVFPMMMIGARLAGLLSLSHHDPSYHYCAYRYTTMSVQPSSEIDLEC